jgi:hypothetical protein
MVEVLLRPDQLNSHHRLIKYIFGVYLFLNHWEDQGSEMDQGLSTVDEIKSILLMTVGFNLGIGYPIFLKS